MRKTLTWIWILSKRTLKSPILLILLLTIPIIALTVNKLPGFASELSYCAGIYLEGEDSLAKSLCASLVNADGIFKFVEYKDLDQMYEDVKTEKINCGYILPANLTHRTGLANCEGSITVVKPPNTNIQPAINEFVYAALLKLQNLQILPKFMQDTGYFDELSTEQIDELISYYKTNIDSGLTFKIIFQTYGVTGLTEENGATKAVTFPLRGILSVMVFLAGIMGAALYLMDGEKGIFDTLDKKLFILCRVVYTLIPTLLFGLSAIITLLLSGSFTIVWIEILSMLLLIVLVTLFGQLLITLTRNSKICIACIPALLVACLIFCPVFLNASSYVPAAKVIEKLFVPYYYLSMF